MRSLTLIDRYIAKSVAVPLLGTLAGAGPEVGWYVAASTLSGLTLLVTPLIDWVLTPVLARGALRSQEDLYAHVRQATEPILAVAIPGLELIFKAVRVSWLARVVAVAMILAIGYQFADFLHWYRYRGPARTQVFEAGVQPMLAQAFAHGRTVYIDYDDHYAQTHALWYAVSHGMSRSRVSILPDGGIPPVGSVLFYRFQRNQSPEVTTQVAPESDGPSTTMADLRTIFKAPSNCPRRNRQRSESR